MNLRKRLFYALTIVVLSMLVGCSSHMTRVNAPNEDLRAFAKVSDTEPENFLSSSVYIINFHDIAYDMEGVYGLDYYIALLKDGLKGGADIEDSSDLLRTKILKIDGEQKLVLFDYGNKIKTIRKILIQSRVVPGIQFPVEGGIEKVCARGLRRFDWDNYQTMDHYIATGQIKVVKINELNDAGHQYLNKLIFDIFAKYDSLDDESTFASFLKGLGTFSSNEIQFMIAGSFNPAQIYPAIGVKAFSVFQALSGAADLSDIYYYTRNANAFDVAAMMYNNVARLKAKIQKELYLENRIQNGNLFDLELRELEVWRDNEIEKINDWRTVCFETLEIDPTNKSLNTIDKNSVVSVNNKAEKYILRIVARFEKRAAFLKELYHK